MPTDSGYLDSVLGFLLNFRCAGFGGDATASGRLSWWNAVGIV